MGLVCQNKSGQIYGDVMLSRASAGPVVDPETILRTDFRSLSAFLTAPVSEETGTGGPAAMSIDTSASQPASNPARSSVQESILSTILDECIFHSRSEASAYT